MAYTLPSLNNAISLKLADLDQATGWHRALFTSTQLSGTLGFLGGVLIAPIALEVGAIAAGTGLALYGVSQLIQSKRIGHFLPIPGVSLSGEQLAYGINSLVAGVMGGAAPDTPQPVKLLPTDWLPEKEQRVNYLLTHCPDLIVAAAQNAQEGISLAAIVDAAVRASEYAITDEQLSNPITARKLAPEVRKILQGDTSTLEAQQAQAIQGEYHRALAAHEAGELSAGELAGIRQQVEELAPTAIEAKAFEVLAPATEPSPVSMAAPGAPAKSAYESITASPYKSRFFLGGQRSGKSYLAISTARHAQETRGVQIYYLNLSSWGTEDDGYSSIATHSLTANIQRLDEQQAEQMVAGARNLLQAFFLSDRPSILVLEEWSELGSRNHQHKALLEPLLQYSASIIEQLANTGQKREKAVYATGPMFVAGGLQQATKAAKSMALVLVAIAPGITAFFKDQALTFDPAVFSMAANNWHGVMEPNGHGYQGDRIAFVDGAWRDVGNIPAMPPATAKPVVEAYGASPFKQAAPCVATAENSPLDKPYGNTGRTVGSLLGTIARYLHKHHGKVRGESTICSQAFSGAAQAELKAMDDGVCFLLRAIVRDYPDHFEISADGKAAKCHTPLTDKKGYYEDR